MLRCHLFSIEKSASNRCRYGCGVIENLEHVLFSCIKCSAIQMKVLALCKEKELNFSLEILMCNPSVHLLTEQFLVFIDK